MSGTVVTIMLAAAQAAAGPTMPSAVTPSAPSAPCRIVDARHGEGPADVYAACASSSVRLGAADGLASSFNVAGGKTLVVRQSAVRTDVVLVSQDAAGAPVIQDVSRDVVHAALVAGLPRGVRPTFDLSRFAATGALVLSSRGPAAGAATKTAVIDLTDRLRAGP